MEMVSVFSNLWKCTPEYIIVLSDKRRFLITRGLLIWLIYFANTIFIKRSNFGIKKMTIKQYQQEVDSWIQTVGVRYFSPLTNMAILTEEVGEVARLLARIHGDQSFKESEKAENHLLKLEDELCDVIWVVTCLANQSGIDLTKALQNNFDKKNKRDSERHKNNEKLNS